jgi:hypothetical protein
LRRQIDRLGSKALEYGFRFGTRAPDVGRWSPMTPLDVNALKQELRERRKAQGLAGQS